MTKPLAALLLSVCFCVSTWSGRDVATVDRDAIEQEIRNALQESNVTVDRDAIEQEVRNALQELTTQLPELLKAIRINVQVPEIDVRIPEIQVPEIKIPEINIPEINIPEIRIQIPKIDIDTHDLPK